MAEKVVMRRTIENGTRIPGLGSFTIEWAGGDLLKVEPRYPDNKTSGESLRTLSSLLQLLGVWQDPFNIESMGINYLIIKTKGGGWTGKKDVFCFRLAVPKGVLDEEGWEVFLEINPAWAIEFVAPPSEA